MKWILLILVLVMAAPASAEEMNVATLAEWMTGSFSSAAQAEDDSNFYDIRLEMAPVWKDRDDAHWLYVEQAVGSMPQKPYRQRVYRVRHLEGNLYESAVFTLPEPENYVGVWQKEEPLDNLTPADLIPREGCTVYLTYMGDERFEGGTRDMDCLSTLKGAAYATSEVVIIPGRVESWDRGFDAEGNQIWGAETGPYIFIFDSGPFK